MSKRASVRPMLVAICLAAATIGTVAAPADAAKRPKTGKAKSAAIPVGATWLVGKLGEGAAKHAGSEAFGWLLSSFGLGSGNAAQLDAIVHKLNQIRDHLDRIDATTQQLRRDVSHGTYSTLAAHAASIISKVEYGIGELRYIAKIADADAATRKRATDELLDYIRDNLLGSTQIELDKYVSGSHGTDGLIVAASKSARAHTRYWTKDTSRSVQDVFDYYQTVQAQLLLLRTEYWHARGHTDDHAYVERHIESAGKLLTAQQKWLKPAPPAEVIADTHTNLDWSWSFVFAHGTYELFAWEIYPLVSEQKNRLPTVAELDRFLDKRPKNHNWATWLRDTHHVTLLDPLPHAWLGVYTQEPDSVFGTMRFVLQPRGLLTAVPRNASNGYGAFGVRTRAHDYWW